MSDILEIGPSKLEGEVTLSGAKNSVLKLLAASLLTDEDVIIKNFPESLSDAQIHLDMLEKLGKKIELFKECKEVKISQSTELPNELIWDSRSIRNTLLILGSVFARKGEMAVPHPGGCKLGERKHDIHISILESFGAIVEESDTTLKAKRNVNKLVSCDIHLPMRSTGATENAILIASLAEGTTNIWNPHIRPEIIDLIQMLRKMGAKIHVNGQERIIVEGVPRLGGAVHTVIPDNMEALTWSVGALITGGTIEIPNFPFEHLELPLIYLRESGALIYRCGDRAIIQSNKIFPLDISTGPYPGINSDMQPILASFASCAHGHSTIVDLRFVGRYAYAEQFNKMNINTNIQGSVLKIEGRGREMITPAEVKATDLRAGISLALLGMASLEGPTTITDAWQIERGYCNFREKLQSLGASFK